MCVDLSQDYLSNMHPRKCSTERWKLLMNAKLSLATPSPIVQARFALSQFVVFSFAVQLGLGCAGRPVL